MKNKKSVIPNFFTTLNIFCGFLAIISIIEDNVITACWLIAIAGICDALDGQLARLTKTNSEFGIEFDSLADVISFGMAPSILLYKVYLSQLGRIGIIISFLPLVMGGIRLARFNVIFGGKAKTKFIGLPIPNMALNFAAFVIFNYHFWGELYLSRFIIPQVLLCSILMVSTVEYYTLPKASFKHSTRNTIGIILILFFLTLLAFFPRETFYPLSIGYILWGVVRFIFKLIKGNGNDDALEIIAP